MILAPTSENILQAAECIKQGGLMAYPTETVYGLGVDPFNRQALSRLFQAKGRATEKAIIVLIPDRADLSTLTSEIPPLAESLMDTFWPGPLTLIFNANSQLPGELLGGKDTIALRHSSAPVAHALLEALGSPLTSSSANVSGQSPGRSARDVETCLGPHLSLILDGGALPRSRPSTLLDISTDDPILIREGVITQAELQPYI
jgi:L-threonylcarbamoyladenylate synthase